MAIASVGGLGLGANSTSNASYTFNTTTNALAAGDFALLVSVSDNTATVDGDNNEHTSVSGGTGAWTKLGEYGNISSGAAAGVVVSVWLFQATGTVSIGTTITLNFSDARVDKCCSFWKYTKAANANIYRDSSPPTNPITSEVNGATGFGSSAFSGLSSAARLYFRGLGKEANTTSGLGVSAGFNQINTTRSRNNANAVCVWAEMRINTSTGETSNPSLAVTGDTAGLFFALVEAANTNGTLTATLGGITLSSTGTVDVAGTASGTLGALTATSTGTVAVVGNSARTLGALTSSAAGTVDVTGSANSTLGALSQTSTGAVAVSGASAPALGQITASAAGTVTTHGELTATLGSLALSAAGTASSTAISGSLAVTLGSLTCVATNVEEEVLTVIVTGSLTTGVSVTGRRGSHLSVVGALSDSVAASGSYVATVSVEGSRP